MDAAIIQPYRIAEVGTEVGGIIESFGYEEGDFVKRGDVVVEISRSRHELVYERAKSRLAALKKALKRARTDTEIKDKLFKRGAITKLESLDARALLETAEAQVAEAEQALKLAGLDVKSCTVQAPFSGHVTVRHKHPFEPVARLDKLFEIVDVSKVYAVANIPESLVPYLKKGTKAVFEHASGLKLSGVVHKTGKRMDPKSKTKKIFVLIDNPNGELEMGMSGSICRTPAKPRSTAGTK